MEDLLEQFDPLSINNQNQNNNNHQNNNNQNNHNHHQKPLNNPTTTTSIRSSSNTIPLFLSTTTNPKQNNTTNNTPNQKWKIKLPTDSLSSNNQDPLGFLSNHNTQSQTIPSNSFNNLKHKPSNLFAQAQIRSKLRQDALAKHLAHEPFKPTSPATPTIPLQNELLQTPSTTDQPPLINLLDEETVTCLNPIQTSPTPNNPSSISPSPITANSTNNSIKIPPELFQNRLNKNKKQHQLEPEPKIIITRPEPRITKPVDEHKLAAALLEGFDDFVSASPNLSSSSPSLQTSTQVITDHPILSFNSNPNPLSPPHKKNKNFDSSCHSTPLSSFEGHEGIPNPIQFIGINPQSQLVMDDELAEGIRLHLPNRLKISSEWKLIYSIDQDGSSLRTLYSKLDQTTRGGGGFGSNDSTRAGFILVLKDHLGQRFGGFVNEPFHPSKEYYGSGECFLWKAVEFAPDDFRIGIAIKAYTWTGINDYMILSDHDLLSIGGGDGKFGLWIDSNLLKGSSTKCPAFNNEILSSCISNSHNNNHNKSNKNEDEEEKEGSFDVIGLECWMVSV